MKDEKLYKEFVREGKLLNHKMFLDYTEVWESKMRYCRYMYLQERENTFAEPAYYTFSKENKEWLYPYALFSALRDHFKTAEFKKWGKVDGVDCSVYSDKLVIYIFMYTFNIISTSRCAKLKSMHTLAELP